MRLFKRTTEAPPVERAIRSPQPVTLSAVPLSAMGGGYGPSGMGRDVRVYLPGSVRDWATEAGPLWRNSIVSACVNLIGRTFPEAPICLTRELKDGSKETIHVGHPFLDLMDRPNPFHTADHIWWAVLMSLNTNGNAYLIKRRDGGGRVRELYWVPSWLMAPRWPMDGSEFITDYLYRSNGKGIPIPTTEIVHLRAGADPTNHGRTGICPLAAQLREIVTDNEAGTYEASLLKNGAVPGLIARPKSDATVSPPVGWMDKLKETIERRFGGDDRGKPLVAEGPLDIDMVSWSPEQMALDVIRQYPETRICAALGVPPALLGLKAGAEQSTYSNMEAYDEAFYDRCIVPTKTTIAREIQSQLFDLDFGGDGWRVDWDYSGVECLQEDRDALAKRVALLVNVGILTPNEARQEMGMQAFEGDPEMDMPRKKQAPEAKPAKDPAKPEEENPADEKAPKANAADRDAIRARSMALIARVTDGAASNGNGNGKH